MNVNVRICLTLLLAMLAPLLTYQLTDGTWMGFTWVVVALLVAAGKTTVSISETAR